MSARGRLGGLAAATRGALHVLDAAAYDLLVIETVGVGQSELDVAGAADTVLVVVTPAMGDAVQIMKAGVLEIADVFALNKADLEGAGAVLRALRGMLHDRPPAPWTTPIVETRARGGDGIEALWERIAAHRAYLESSGELGRRRDARLRAELVGALERGLLTGVLRRLLTGERYAELLAEVRARRRDPGSAARALLVMLDAE
jgi:LAO/AO transport system kinase